MLKDEYKVYEDKMKKTYFYSHRRHIGIYWQGNQS